MSYDIQLKTKPYSGGVFIWADIRPTSPILELLFDDLEADLYSITELRNKLTGPPDDKERLLYEAVLICFDDPKMIKIENLFEPYSDINPESFVISRSELIALLNDWERQVRSLNTNENTKA